jgi:hypothetical protein
MFALRSKKDNGSWERMTLAFETLCEAREWALELGGRSVVEVEYVDVLAFVSED